MQAQYTALHVIGSGGFPDRFFQGGYVEAAWVVNGRGRRYILDAPYGSYYATLQGVQVENDQRISNGGIGIFEVAARLSRLDLDASGVRGGAETDLTLGINWYPDRNLRVLVDYVHARAALDPTTRKAVAGSDILVSRVNFYW